MATVAPLAGVHDTSCQRIVSTCYNIRCERELAEERRGPRAEDYFNGPMNADSASAVFKHLQSNRLVRDIQSQGGPIFFRVAANFCAVRERSEPIFSNS